MNKTIRKYDQSLYTFYFTYETNYYNSNNNLRKLNNYSIAFLIIFSIHNLLITIITCNYILHILSSLYFLTVVLLKPQCSHISKIHILFIVQNPVEFKQYVCN